MDYQEKLREYINQAFQRLPDTEEVRNTREELSADLLDYYSQALGEGQEPEKAYETALGRLGNIAELTDALGGRTEPAVPPPPPHHEPGHPVPPPPPHHEPGHPVPPPPHHEPGHPAPPPVEKAE